MKNKKKRKKYWFSNGFTLMVVPDNHQNTIKIRFHKSFFLFFLILFFSIVFFSLIALLTIKKEIEKQKKYSQDVELLSHQIWLHKYYQKEIQKQLHNYEKAGKNFYKEIWLSNKNPKSQYNRNENIINNSLTKDPFNKVLHLNKTLDFLIARETSYKKIPLGWPIRTGRVTSPFGRRVSPFGYSIDFHAGTDFAAPPGTPIYATAGGLVTYSGTRRDGYGYQVRVEHEYGFVTLYAHCSRVLVKIDQVVKRGDPIALLGMTGAATGPHVHYEIRLKQSDNFSNYEIFLNPWPFARENL